MTGRHGYQWGLFALLLVDVVLLAALELFYLPLRLDGLILPAVDAVPVPVTVVLAVVTTPLLVREAARVTSPRLAVVPLVLWLVTVFGIGLAGPGRDLVLLQDWRALLLLAGGALPAALALGGVLARSPGRGAVSG
ncbi:hypothetical protein [Amycolatopsis cihanbeyliensis]|uniref:Uncharacterized protein n=1 Tax=Amycolatopsis cihanbeyliensis TaxID=1128664 RepID=A0A542DHP4_AMYCI|nr:hypothetical protein [Amycolatopsis cihanbeyliensis]TQJ02570.1 hypothetical protein FB471_2302 [Amycolatopsis cihanbeyliensis]